LWQVGSACGELTYRLWRVAYIHVASWFCGELESCHQDSNPKDQDSENTASRRGSASRLPITAILMQRSLFRHIVQLDANADAKILTAVPPEDWKRPPGRPTIN